MRRYRAFLESWGVKSKLEVRSLNDNMSAPEFCGFHARSPRMGGLSGGPPLPAPIRTLKKLGVTTKAVSKNGESPAAYARLKALSVLAMYNGVPLFTDIARETLKLYPRGRVTKRMVQKDAPYWLSPDHLNLSLEEAHRRIIAMAGVPPAPEPDGIRAILEYELGRAGVKNSNEPPTGLARGSARLRRNVRG